jgi:Fic family protein
METLVSEINDKIGQVQTFDQKCELAFELHYRFAGIYPFVDGNGRTGRLLMNYLLTLFDLPAFCAFKKNRISYILALENARMTDDRPDFYACMYKQYQLFLEKELKAIEG